MFCYTIMLKNTDNMRKVLNIIHYTAYGYIRPESRFNASLATNTKKKKTCRKIYCTYIHYLCSGKNICNFLVLI